MLDHAEPLDACTDSCVLINLAHVSRLDLLGQIENMTFHVPREVMAEINEPGQAEKVESAIREGALRMLKMTDAGELRMLAEYAERFGKGESACLAVASYRGWVVATDETKGRRLIKELAGNGIKIINTPGILLQAIRQRVVSVEDADQIKGELEGKRFRMSFKSFRELV